MDDINITTTPATTLPAKPHLSTPTTPKTEPRNWDTLLNDAIAARETWEVEEARTNQTLYHILSDCLSALQALELGSTSRNKFIARYEDEGFPKNKNTPLAAKVIRYVFNYSDRRKVSPYARVLSVAHAADVNSRNLPKWITDQGGIEQIRRNKQNQPGTLSKTQAINAAESLLADADCLANLDNPPDEINPVPGENFSVVIIRHNGDGTASIVQAVKSKAVVHSVLASAGHALHSKAEILASEDAERERKSERERATIDAVAA